MANRMGNVLLGLDVEMEDRVLMALPDCIEFVATWFAIAKAGAVITMVNRISSGHGPRSRRNGCSKRIGDPCDGA